MPSTKHKLHKAAPAPMLRQFEPMLPTFMQKPFSSQQWLFEPKWDGWRAMCFVKDGEAHFISRKQNSLTERFPQLKQAANSIQAATAVLDGEILALDENGLPRFEGLRSRRANTAVVFYAFDLLYLDGFDLTRCPLIKRKALHSHHLDSEAGHLADGVSRTTGRAMSENCRVGGRRPSLPCRAA